MSWSKYRLTDELCLDQNGKILSSKTESLSHESRDNEAGLSTDTYGSNPCHPILRPAALTVTADAGSWGARRHWEVPVASAGLSDAPLA
ncbi:hypothetical protein NDU88_007505 [Pleurodeles waltl]|uniref:Uncharacterized protein n=1 Tax=Pleurodeles waltl TaxID=8319 RepID=A0AAV7U0A1_PLEWA|nr:hypothetical protein NDU88_007505 [Pleurodeles waltl]